MEVLKGEKDRTQDKLEKLHAVLEKERGALRDVLQAARKAVDDLKVCDTSDCESNFSQLCPAIVLATWFLLLPVLQPGRETGGRRRVGAIEEASRRARI